MRGWGQEKEKLQTLVVDTCDLFLALTVDAISSGSLGTKCVGGLGECIPVHSPQPGGGGRGGGGVGDGGSVPVHSHNLKILTKKKGGWEGGGRVSGKACLYPLTCPGRPMPGMGMREEDRAASLGLISSIFSCRLPRLPALCCRLMYTCRTAKVCQLMSILLVIMYTCRTAKVCH